MRWTVDALRASRSVSLDDHSEGEFFQVLVRPEAD